MIEDVQIVSPNGTELAVEKPVFDFEELSWGDSLKLTEAQVLITEISEHSTVTGEDMRKMYDAFLYISDYLAKITVSVPRAWLVKTAPDHLDFSDPASFGHVKQKRIPSLMQALRDAQEAEKNG